MDCRFHVGQKVICIDASIHEEWYHPILRSWYPHNGSLNGLTEGEQYTITWIGPYTGPLVKEMICVHVKEIKRPLGYDNNTGVDAPEAPFAACRFRPLIDLNTFGVISRKLVTPKKKTKVLEEV
jgi:hypothetical protein